MLTPMADDLPEAREHQAEILAQCGHLFEAGHLQVHVAHRLPLAEAAEAHRLIERGGVTGKIVLMVE
jgi:NADPH2:quinone reductase